MKIKSKQYAQGLFDSLLGKSNKEQTDILDNFAQVLLTNNHTSQLEEILGFFNTLWNKHNNIVEAELVSTSKLEHSIIEDVRGLIFQETGSKSIEIKETRNKNILGGIVLKYNDKLIDLSLKTRLHKFRDNLIN